MLFTIPIYCVMIFDITFKATAQQIFSLSFCNAVLVSVKLQ